MDAYYEPNPSPAWRDSVRSEPWKDEGATGAGAPLLALASSVPLAIVHAGAAVLNWHTHRSMKKCLEDTANLVQSATASPASTGSISPIYARDIGAPGAWGQGLVQGPSENDANADQETVGETAGVGTKIENQVCLSARARVTSEAQIGACVQDLGRLTK